MPATARAEVELDLYGVYLPATAAGRRLGVSRSRVWQFIRAGRLPAVQVGDPQFFTKP